ncbi:MAG: CDGSH iron-sulfur domain-containing protein [Thermoplasmata archaeon]
MPRVELKSAKDGPNLVMIDGKVTAAICRCGQSATKPTCDGSHKRVAFSAPEALTVLLE